MTRLTTQQEQVQRQNDLFRRAGPVAPSGGKWTVTQGVLNLFPDAVAEAVHIVRQFSAFATDVDPWGERDFGAFELAGERLFWKIDYFDQDMTLGSPDPADPAVTCRVLTILLASEY